MKHTHHIIPKHMGGTDDPSNLVELTIEKHALAHKKLYEQHGCWQDYVAWKGLEGVMTEEERMEIMYAARRGKGNHFYGKKHTEETKLKISQNRTGKGKIPKPDSMRQKLSERNKGEGNPMYGKEPWNKGKSCPASESSKIKKGRPLIYNGVQYYGILEAARQNNTSQYFIRKHCTFIDKL